jgi:CBS domain-containing protein
MRCEELMTRNPICVLPQDSVDRAAQLMKREDVGSLPVVESEESRRLVGIITDRDLALKVVGEGREPRSTRVESAMSRQVVTVRAGDDVQQALDRMADRQIRRIPVVDNEQKVVGIIAQADVATKVSSNKSAEVVKDISKDK